LHLDIRVGRIGNRRLSSIRLTPPQIIDMWTLQEYR
jgi:hypothetical protein